MVTVTRDGVAITDFEGKPQHARAQDHHWSAVQAEKGGFKHFMLKEIHEQPRAVADTLRGRVDLENDDVDARRHRARRHEASSASSSSRAARSYHASMVGEFLVESLARIPVEVELASEFRYRDPIVGPGDLVVAVSQSGETLDTMAAIREAKKKGAQVLAIANVVEARSRALADDAFYTHAGPEIGVASTKAFTTQLVAHRAARDLPRPPHRHARRASARASCSPSSSQLPHKMRDVVEQGAQLQVLARRYGQRARLPVPRPRRAVPDRARGRAQAQGDLVHPRRGLRRRRDEARPDRADRRAAAGRRARAAAARATRRSMSNLAEVRARQGKVLAIATRGDNEIGSARRRRRPRPRDRARAAAAPHRAAAAAARATTSPTSRAPTSTSRATSRRPSPSSSGATATKLRTA